MKEKEFLDSVSNIEIDVVERFISMDNKLQKKSNKQKMKGVWLRFGAVAACIALIVGAIIVVPMLREDGTGADVETSSGATEEDDRPSIPIVNPQAPSSAPKYYGSETSGDGGDGLATEINTTGVSVIARLIEVLPDTYTFFDDWSQSEFHLLKMETLKLLKGRRMTETFYYIVPEEYMTDFTAFDKFIIVDMGQYGYENSVLYNKTENCAERLDVVLMGYVNTLFEFMGENFMAFDSEGNFDGRLWGSTEAWASSTGWPNNAIGQPNKYLNGYTIEKAEQDFYSADGYRSVSVLDGVSGEAKEALKHIQSFENGLYIQRGDGFKASKDISLNFHRYINGFATNETGMIFSDSVTWSNARFSKEDEQKLPDLAGAFDSVKEYMEKDLVIPPHFSAQEELRTTTSGIFGWYAKTENGIVGIIRVTWCFCTEKYKLYFDDAYYIIEYGSDECKPVDRDDLLEIVGAYEKTYIYTGKYNEYGKYSDIVYLA